MAFFVNGNNQTFALNNHISSVINPRSHSSTLLCVPLIEHTLHKVNIYSTHILKYFSPSCFNNLQKCINQWKMKKYSKNDNFKAFPQISSPKYDVNSPDLLVYKLSNVSHIDRITKSICLNPRSQHLINQIRLFRSGRHEKEHHPSLYTRVKVFIGLQDIKSNKSYIRKDLDEFQNKINQENMKPEQSQKVLLAFVEGYLLAREHLITQRSTWRLSRLSIAIAITGVVLFILKQNISISILNSSNLPVEVSESNVKFNDVKGADEAKQELKNVVEFLKNPDKFSALGGKLPKGVLLVGPPGTGKTLLAKAVAGEAGVPFFSTSGPEFDEIYVGVGAKRIRELFKIAKENIPCVIFIDEIDSIGKVRTSSSLHPHANDTINQLLSEMDGFHNSEGIIVLGATNRRDDLDKALLRPGRFDVEITVSIPDFKGRTELLQFYLSKIRHQNVDVERLARGTTNFTGADIENMVNQAALRAAMMGAPFVQTDHLEHARDKALMGPESMSRIADEETNRITAYHEGGHTVVAYFTEHAQPLHKVTIIARGSSLGHTAYIPDKDIYHVTKTQLMAMLDAMMGGRAAEELVFGSEKITSGASSDLEKATELASKMVRSWGMSEEVGLTTFSSHQSISENTASLIDSEVKKILQDSYERAKNILISHREKHKELSEALLKNETLDADEIAAIMKGVKNIKPQT